MVKLAVIPIRANPKRKRRKATKIHKRHKGRRAHKIKRERRAHGYLVQGEAWHGTIKYLTREGKWSRLPQDGRRYSTLKEAREACLFNARNPGFRWVQPVPA